MYAGRIKETGLGTADLGSLWARRWEDHPSELCNRLAPFPRADYIPLSLSQQQIWFREQLQPGAGLDQISFCAWLSGALNTELLQKSLKTLAQRHETLRTTFSLQDGVPHQVVHPQSQVQVELTDLRHLPTELRQSEALQLAGQAEREPFDLQAGPLARVRTYQIDQERHLFLFVIHPIVCDRRALRVALTDLSTIYSSCLADAVPALPDLPFQYRDYAVWQSKFSLGSGCWGQGLSDVTGLTFPIVNAAWERVTRHTEWLEFSFLPELTDPLRTLSEREGVPVFVVLLTAVHVLFTRWSGHADFAVTLPSATPVPTDMQYSVGNFETFIMFRSYIPENLTFRECLRLVNQECLRAHLNRDWHLQVPTESRPSEETRRHPLCQVSFNVWGAPLPAVEFSGVAVGPVGLGAGDINHDIEIHLYDVAGKTIRAELGYRTELFDPACMERIVGELAVLLKQVIANSDAPIRALQLLPDAEWTVMSSDWSHGPHETVPIGCVHDWIEAQAKRTPQAIALTVGSQCWTYQELNSRANQFGHYLRALGVGPETFVGVCLGRSVDLVVALLGIWKAGGAYLPLDPTYPTDRLSFMLEDSAAPIIVTEENLMGRLSDHGCRVVCIDLEREAISDQPDSAPMHGSGPSNLAYILYTSGSTGRAKGVMIEHHSTASFVHWATTVFSAEELAEVLASTSICFDLSVFELFVPLTCGGKVVMAESSLHLAAMPEAQRITLINTVPSAMAELVRMNAIPQSVRTVNLAGEPLPSDLVNALYERGHIQKVYNLYGPTETTTYSIYALAEPGTQRRPPIGRPLANTSVYLLDSQFRPVPVGIPGEIYIGGAGVARGYLNRPELTAERFVSDPYGGEGARLYRTSDLARFLPDGNIEYLGRLDHQVKVRGFRVELGEIEAQLGRHPAVQRVAVTVCETPTGDRCLVGYVVPRTEPEVAEAELGRALRLHLMQTLPAYMIPSHFVPLESLPLLPNGKINRALLPAPAWSEIQRSREYEAPRSATELVLARIWSEVLGIEQVGIHDNFYELGGHSLAAVRILSRVHQELQVELPLGSLMKVQTLAALAETIELRHHEGTTEPSALITPIPRDGLFPCPLSFSQQRLWLLDQLNPGNPAFNIPLALTFEGPLDVAALKAGLLDVIKRHEVFNTTFALENGCPTAVIGPGSALNMSVIDLEAEPEHVREELVGRFIREESHKPFDLTSGPLLQATLVRTADTSHLLLLVMHHIVFDGWSTDLLISELHRCYVAHTANRPADLPELAVQYLDYAYWQRQWLQGKNLNRLLEYWRKQLDGVRPLDLPIDYPRPPVQTYQGAIETMSLSPELSKAVRSLAKQEGATVYMVLLAAFMTLLGRYASQDDIAVGTPVANRNRSDTQSLIGFFVNTLVLRTSLTGNPTFRQVLLRVREAALAAYDHQDLPFELLVEELNPVRQADRTPLFQVWFNLQPAPVLPQQFTETLSVQTRVIDHGKVMFDLELTVLDSAEGFDLALAYNLDLFEANTTRTLLDHLVALLEHAVAEPDVSLSRLRLPSGNRRPLPNRIAPDNPYRVFEVAEIEQSLPHRIESMVRLHPNRLAVKSARYAWTYAELNNQADRLARSLLGRFGPGPANVALLFEPDAPLVLAIMAALKAGKTYVPLDPALPLERLELILEDSQVDVILTNERNRALAYQLAGDREVVAVDDAEIAHGAPADSCDSSWIAPETVAYILYTSGSTGRPKGVVQSHRNVLHHIRQYTNNLHLCAEDRLSLLASYSFDAAVMDIFGALLNGATLCLFDVKERGVSQLAGWLESERITVYHSTPTLFRYLVTAMEDNQELTHLRLVVLGGEEVNPGDVAAFKEHFGRSTLLVNGFGPTECTIALQYFIQPGEEVWRKRVPIGYPVDGIEVLLLDESGEENGLYGEIAIRSPYIALGYWRRPELTELSFLPDPDQGERRIYRTGDMGRLLPDGAIEYLGRKDHQVKIRGVRIEVGDVEAVLNEHPHIQTAVVVPRKDQRGEKQLVAFYIPRTTPSLSVNELQEFLRTKLPTYMIPASFRAVEALPMTPSGKVDRLALSDAPEYDLGPSHSYTAPRTPIEQQLVAVWAEVLGVAQIGITDNFFELGGHSLLAMQVLSRIQRAFEIELPLRVLFEAPTIADLSVAIVATQASSHVDGLAHLLDQLEQSSSEEIAALLEEEGDRQ